MVALKGRNNSKTLQLCQSGCRKGCFLFVLIALLMNMQSVALATVCVCKCIQNLRFQQLFAIPFQSFKIDQFSFATDRETMQNDITARFMIYETSIQSVCCPSSSISLMFAYTLSILTFNGFCIRPFSFNVIPFKVVLLQIVEVYKFHSI